MPNFLEQLVAEWFELEEYFVWRNVNVGKRKIGGWDCELDVVAFNPAKKHLIHIEPSTDSHNWETREKRFKKKFDAGKKHIPSLFKAFHPLPKIDSVALLVYGSRRNRESIGGGRILMVGDFLNEIREGIADRSVAKNTIPEQYVILRSLLFVKTYWK
jgi:hypothetical protein